MSFPVRLMTLSFALAFVSSINAVVIGPSSDLIISNAQISPDGYSRSAVLAGGTFPGPAIRGKKGDRFLLNVVNQLSDNTMEMSTSVHWHGISQKGTNWADGVSFITQCPITPNDSFLYDFHVANQAGTYWYHSHLTTQYCDGLRGPFIVDDPDDPHKQLYDVDDESTIITLADWIHTPALSSLVPGQLPPASVATLINGKGRYIGGPAVPLSVINVAHGVRYRFRIIAMSCDADFTFSIDNHTMTVIEADGENTTPLTVDSIRIYPGQRYSVVVKADQQVDNHWIRALPNRGSGGNLAIFRYLGAPIAEPSRDPQVPLQSVLPFNEVNLHALENSVPPGMPFAGGADVVLNLAQTINQTTVRFFVNGVGYAVPTVPVLLQILSGAQAAQNLLPKGSIYSLPSNKVIEISIPGLDTGGPHPWHLHGHSFYVIRSAESETYNFVNPVRRDVVNTGSSGSNVTIRFLTDNAGPWLLHCHIDWHLQLGLSVILVEDIQDIAVDNPVSHAWTELCPRYASQNPQ